jgi:predicted O-linked N-acetylglucosamine transferase (SPINDLY family)
MPDADLAKKIARVKIDILIDLSGHTGLNRLPCLARKPAPVQASWIGYPGTTGLSAIDYFFADRFYLPHAEFDPQFSEEIVYLPAYAPFLPFQQTPDINALPALTNGFLTFGSFNRPIKINARIVGIWSRLLHALPDSRMILGAMQPDFSYLAECFEQHGIARERLEFHPRTDVQSYLELHHQVDLCLDTFPYTGITTALNALWMGVPTLTIAGSTPPGRLTTMALYQLELESFVAKDAENFVAKGKAWANNLQDLTDIRCDLRNRINHSILMHPEDIATGLETVLREIWQRWCNNQTGTKAN